MKKVEIVKDNCISCGMCVNMADHVFTFDAEGKSEVISQNVDENIINIAGLCPTAAIIITED